MSCSISLWISPTCSGLTPATDSMCWTTGLYSSDMATGRKHSRMCESSSAFASVDAEKGGEDVEDREGEGRKSEGLLASQRCGNHAEMRCDRPAGRRNVARGQKHGWGQLGGIAARGEDKPEMRRRRGPSELHLRFFIAEVGRISASPERPRWRSRDPGVENRRRIDSP